MFQLLPINNIRLKLRFLLITSNVLLIFFAAIFTYFSARTAIRNESIAGLEALRGVRTEQVQEWITERQRDILVLSQDPTVILSTRAFVNNLDTSDTLGETRNERQESLREQYLGQPDLEQPETISIYSTTHNRFHSFYRTIQQSYDYADVMLISPDGEIVYTAEKADDFQANVLVDGLYTDSELQIIVEEVLAAESQTAVFSDFSYYTPVDDIIIFYAVPVIENNTLLGILITSINIEPINEILGLRVSLGETGETYVIGPDNLVRNELAQVNARDGQLNIDTTILNASFPVDTTATREVLAGNTGTEIIDSYLEVQTLSTWQPLELKQPSEYDIDGVNWGLIAEKEISEVDEPINSLLLNLLVLGAILTLIAAWVTYVVSNQIANPIVELTTAAAGIARGNIGQQVKVQSNDEIGQLAVTFNDMSHRLATNIDDLKEANAAAQEASRLKSEFLATMSHELRTPLNAIEGFTSIMLGGLGVELNPKARRMVERIGSNSKRLLHLINDFLDLSRIEAGRLELVDNVISPQELSQQWKKEIEVFAENKGIEFEVIISPELPEKIIGDEDALSKIGLNLLSNAFKFTHEGKVQLKFDRQANKWMISVTDTGIGIPTHAREYIFDEFRQVDGSSTREYGGTGLGLSLVEKLTRASGGNVTCESEVNVGTTFTVTLPLKTAN